MKRWNLLWAAAFIALLSGSAIAQPYTGFFARKSKAVNVTPTRGEISGLSKKNYRLNLEWGRELHLRNLLIYANESQGVYLVKRILSKGVEAYGIGPDFVAFLESKGAIIVKPEGFNPKFAYLVRWHRGKYIIENEDFELDKMFRVYNQFLFAVALPVYKDEKVDMHGYSKLELFDSMFFPSRKHRRWKGTNEELETLLPGIKLVSEGKK